jgi:GH15 family glucan-1,4-alpha-glucosidase
VRLACSRLQRRQSDGDRLGTRVRVAEAFPRGTRSAAFEELPWTFFMAPNDPRMLATVDAIRSAATRGGLAADGLVYRYDPAAAPDGLPGVEGTFKCAASGWSRR